MKHVRVGKTLVIGFVGIFLLPVASRAQDSGLAGEIGGLQQTLNTVYNAMIVNCSELIGVGRGIAGFGALCYISFRVWGHIARSEPIDFYPLLRPFAIGLAITLFPAVISAINGLMQPTVAGTAALVTDSNQAVANLLAQKQAALQQSADWQMYVGSSGNGDEEKWEQLSGDASNGALSSLSNPIKFQLAKASYNLKNSIKVWLSELLQVLFEAAALCINTVRTFYLIILAIIGPLVFGLSVFDGLHHILIGWFARYINVFLWLPIANIFGSLINQIQQQMLQLDIAQLQATGQTTFGSTDAAYMIFLILAIVGYFTVPSVANYIINAGSMGAHLSKTTNQFNSAVNMTSSVATTAISAAATQIAGAVKEAMEKSKDMQRPESYYPKSGDF
jgi:conjugative transposon TraJ protein